MLLSYIHTPLSMSLVPLHTKLSNTEKPKVRELCPNPLHLGLTPFKDPQTQLLDHKLHHPFYDAPTADQESKREGSMAELPAIGESQGFNTAVIKEAIVDLHSAHMEFENIQLK